MTVEQAAGYFAMSVNTFRSLDIKSTRFGDRCVRYDKHDLDRFADRLGDQPLTAIDRRAESAEIERRFLEGRRGG